MRVNLKNKNNTLIKDNFKIKSESNSKSKNNKSINSSTLNNWQRFRYSDLYKRIYSKINKNYTTDDLKYLCKCRNKFLYFIDSVFFPMIHIDVFDKSMSPTLHPRDQLVCHRIYNRKRLSWQDVIIIPIKLEDGKSYVLARRIIGLPGDIIEITKAGDISINNKILREPYCIKSMSTNHTRLVVPKNHYFVLCDNRFNNNDSRSFGFISAKQIKYIVTDVFNDKYTYLKSISEVSKL